MKLFLHRMLLSFIVVTLLAPHTLAVAHPKTATGTLTVQSEPISPAAVGDELWDSRFNLLGVSGYVRAIAVSGNDVYVGGQFSAVGSLIANNIARWNSVSGAWSALGSGASGPVYALAVSGSDVYVGGLFASAGGVANTQNVGKWNGVSWTALGSGVSGPVQAIAVSGSDVYVGGQFAAAGGAANTQNIAKWNGVSWTALGSGVSGPVHAIAVNGSDVYVGGQFAAAGGVANTQNVGKWNGASWSALGSGVSGPVHAVAVSGSDVYVGGQFAAAGGAANTQNIAKWNGVSWSALGSGVSGPVQALAVSGSDVYVGGQFAAAGGVANTQNTARWNGTSWSALGGGVRGPVFAVGIGVDGVYVGGLFAQAGNKAAQNFGLWRGTIPAPPNSDDVYWDSRFGGPVGENGPNGRICAMAVSGSDVYVGGDFSMAGGVPASRIAKWDSVSNTWSALGSGITGPGGAGCAVRGIAISGSDVYVGGAFSSAGGVPGTYAIARWNGTNWSPLGGGTSGGGVDDVAVDGGIVYVSGLFSSVNKIVNPTLPDDYLLVNNVAGWNGQWFALGSGANVGVNSTASAVEPSGGNVYVGGGFTMAGGAPANNIARWNGASWSALGSGVNGLVIDIAAAGDVVYAGGTFTTAGGALASYIARWNGTSWSSLGSGVGNLSGTFYAVDGIAVVGNDAYVAGIFTTAGGAPASRIARWNNTAETWSPLGSGLNSDGLDVVLGVNGVYVGGQFSTAGGKPSNFFGVWHTAIPAGGSIAGRVLSAINQNGVPGARVQACRTGHGGCFWTGFTDSQGNYLAIGLPDGSYRVTAYPPASHNLLPNTIGPLTIADGNSIVGQDISLEVNQQPPAGTTISPVAGQAGGLPSLHWKKQLQLVTEGCPGGSASYQILQDAAVISSGPLTESPPPPGRYVGAIAPLHPNSGYATIRITIQCPNNSTQTINFAVYIDPSGTVRTIHGFPIEGATVTLSYFDAAAGTFTIVPAGDAIMSPANRTNPDTTDAEGHFGWDVVAGFYKVRAEKAGCVAPFNAAQPYVETEVLVIPPPVTDLDLRLDCGLNNARLYLPIVQR